MHPRHPILLQVLVGLLFMGFGPVHAQSGIQFFEGSLDAAVSKAAAEDKLVFVDGYAEWCGPCKWMAANAFQDAKVGSFFNHHFVAMQIDLEKGEGPDVAARFQVEAYPTLVFLDGKGEVLRQSAGARDADGLLELAQAVVRRAKPELTGKGQPGDPGFVPVDVFTTLDLATAFAQAKAESKLVFVYLPNAHGGLADPELAKATFADPRVVQALQDKAICVAIEDQGITGLEFASHHPLIDSVNRPIFAPALLFYRADSSLAENWFRDVDVPTFLSLLAAAQGDPGQTLAGKKARILSGAHDENLLYHYLLHAHRTGYRDFDVLTLFLPAMTGKRLLEDRSWEIYRRFRDCFDPSFRDEMLPLVPDLIAKFGKDSIVAELHAWRTDAINYFGAHETAESFDPGIRRIEQVAHIAPLLQADLAFLKMAQCAYQPASPKRDKAFFRNAHALLDQPCSAADRDELCLYLQGLMDSMEHPGQDILQSVLALAERINAQQPTGPSLVLEAVVLHDLKRKADAQKAYHAALESGALDDYQIGLLQTKFEE